MICLVYSVYTHCFVFQLWLALVVTMPCLAPGMSFGYSAIVLDQLQLTVDEQSWFGIYFNFFKYFYCRYMTYYNITIRSKIQSQSSIGIAVMLNR